MKILAKNFFKKKLKKRQKKNDQCREKNIDEIRILKNIYYYLNKKLTWFAFAT